ncbi:hypothetical protein D3C72_1958500 [compost metagenome]
MGMQQRARKDGLRQRQRQGVVAGNKEHWCQLAQRQRGAAGGFGQQAVGKAALQQRLPQGLRVGLLFECAHGGGRAAVAQQRVEGVGVGVMHDGVS